MQDQALEHASPKEKAIEEFKELWIIALFLAVFFVSFTYYRRMVLAEAGVSYLHYGVAVVQAFVIAKFVMIGKVLGLHKLFGRGPLIVSVIARAIVFAVLVIVFGAIEHVVDGLVHKKDWASIVHGLPEGGVDGLFARTIMLVITFIPFFAFWEIGQVLGRGELIALFFSNRRAPSP
jgi:hypothetical protein